MKPFTKPLRKRLPRGGILLVLLSLCLVPVLSCGEHESEESGGEVPAETSPAPETGGALEETEAGGAPGALLPGSGDETFLGELQIDEEFGFSFRTPILFQRASDAFVEQARQAFVESPGAGGPYFTVPRMIFAVPGTDARIFVGEFPAGQGADDPSSWVAGYLEAARSRVGQAAFSHSRIRIGDREALFLRIEGPAFRNDRVLLTTRRGEHVQIDFLLPEVSLLDMEAPVAASIASIEVF